MIKKLKNNKGESLAETLIAVLISALALLMLASMIEHSAGLIAQSNTVIQQYVVDENAIIELDPSSAGSGQVALLTESGSLIPLKADNAIVKYATMPSHPEIIAYEKVGD